MPVSLYRVDDRLIHGQVVEGWVPELKIKKILVISDEVFEDATRKTIMNFSAPENVELVFLKKQDAGEQINKASKEPENALVLFSNVKDAFEVFQNIDIAKNLNIGGIHYSAGKNFSLGKAIFLSDEDCKHLKLIGDLGVAIEGRGVPNDKPLDIMQSLK